MQKLLPEEESEFRQHHKKNDEAKFCFQRSQKMKANFELRQHSISIKYLISLVRTSQVLAKTCDFFSKPVRALQATKHSFAFHCSSQIPGFLFSPRPYIEGLALKRN